MILVLLLLALACPVVANEKPGTTYKVFQFPANMIPRVDGDASDWAMIPEQYVVGGDLSGGPLIERFHPNKDVAQWDAHFSMHGVQAQNYHIFTPALGKD